MTNTNHARSEEFDRVLIPTRPRSPIEAVLRRIVFAVALVLFVALVVRLGRAGYTDVNDDPISFADALYYASVTVTTTGYGDITAVSSAARMATIFLITPARILFLILVVGTTVEVLTDQSRRQVLTKRWRQRVNNHYLICGFGATGHSAAADLISRGVDPSEIVAVDVNADVVAQAADDGFVAIHGDASQQAVLRQAAIDRARAVVIAPNRDDTAVLITLTSRELNPDVHIVAGVKEQENLHLLSQGGADEVIDATAAVGRMLGLGTYAPGVVRVLDDLLDAGKGVELTEVSGDNGDPDGRPSVPAGSTLVAILRNGVRLPASQMDEANLQAGDRLVVVRETSDSSDSSG